MTDSPSQPPALTAANDRWHEILDIRYRQFLESVTALDLEGADRHLKLFNRTLSNHIEFETTHLGPIQGVDDNARKLVDADHLILQRLMGKSETALSVIAAAPSQRAELISQLNEFMRLLNVLRHHDEREKTLLYPAIEARISASESRRLAAMLDAVMAPISMAAPH